MQNLNIISQLAQLEKDPNVDLDKYQKGDIISGFNITDNGGKITDYYELLSCYLKLKPEKSVSDNPHPPQEFIDNSFEVIEIIEDKTLVRRNVIEFYKNRKK